MMKVFDLCGIEGNAYMQAQRDLFQAGVHVVSESGRYEENGVLTSELTPENRKLLNTVEQLQYYRMHDWMKDHDAAIPTPPLEIS